MWNVLDFPQALHFPPECSCTVAHSHREGCSCRALLSNRPDFLLVYIRFDLAECLHLYFTCEQYEVGCSMLRSAFTWLPRCRKCHLRKWSSLGHLEDTSRVLFGSPRGMTGDLEWSRKGPLITSTLTSNPTSHSHCNNSRVLQTTQNHTSTFLIFHTYLIGTHVLVLITNF